MLKPPLLQQSTNIESNVEVFQALLGAAISNTLELQNLALVI
jgi:hypothetical protein